MKPSCRGSGALQWNHTVIERCNETEFTRWRKWNCETDRGGEGNGIVQPIGAGNGIVKPIGSCVSLLSLFRFSSEGHIGKEKEILIQLLYRKSSISIRFKVEENESLEPSCKLSGILSCFRLALYTVRDFIHCLNRFRSGSSNSFTWSWLRERCSCPLWIPLPFFTNFVNDQFSL